MSVPAETSDLSLSAAFDAVCPLCATSFSGMRWQIVDVDARPELVARAGDGSLQRTYCPRCVGPGVEKPGPFALVRRTAGGIQNKYFIPSGAATHVGPEVEAVHAALVQRCDSMGIPREQLMEQGSALLRTPRDFRRTVHDLWPDFELPRYDRSVLGGPLLELLNAQTAEARLRAVLAHPDLARPNIESLMAFYAQSGNDAQRAAAEAAMRFLADTGRIGAPAALQQAQLQEQATQRWVRAWQALPAAVRGELQGFDLTGEIPVTEEECAQVIALGTKLCGDLAGDDLRPLRAMVLFRLGFLWSNCPARDPSGRLDKAIEAYEAALAAVDANDAGDVCRILLELSACWDRRSEGDRKDNIERALELANRAVQLAGRLPQELWARAWMELGILYTVRLTGDRASNATLAREALSNAQRLALTADLRLRALYNEALTYIEEAGAGRSGNALELGIRQLKILAGESNLALLDETQKQNLYQSLGAALAMRVSRGGGDVGDLDLAAIYLAKAISLATSRNRPIEVARIVSLLAAVERDRFVRGRRDHEVSEILDLTDRAAQQLTIDAAPFDFALNEIRRAGILVDLLEPGSFDARITRALEAACEVLTPQSAPHLCRSTHYQLARHQLNAGDLAAAAGHLAIACDAAENLLVATDTAAQRAAEIEPNAELYELYVDTLQRLAAATGATDPEAGWDILEVMERGRARLYLDQMGLRPLPAFQGIPCELLEREQAILAELDVMAQRQQPESPSTLGIDADRLRAQQASRESLNRLWDEIAATGEGGRRHVALRRSQPPDRATLARLTAHMGPTAGVLSFFSLPDRIVAVLLREGAAPRCESLRMDSVRLRREFVDILAAEVLEDAPTSGPGHAAWRALGDVIFGPFAQSLSELELLTLIPYGPLHLLPLHALTVDGRPLIERVAVSYAPSLGVLRTLFEGEFRDPSAGEPFVLSHALTAEEATSFEGEADTVARLFGVSARHHAPRTVLIEGAPRASLIHLACHGYFDPEDPLESAVELADGAITARDWLMLSLKARLVTLSACETGLHGIRRGDELQGLGRNLLEAGASSVLLTLWPVVSTSTAEWMSRFYDSVARPPSGRWALARAFQSATLQLYELDPDPVLWAPFVLIGHPG